MSVFKNLSYCLLYRYKESDLRKKMKLISFLCQKADMWEILICLSILGLSPNAARVGTILYRLISY